MPCRVPCTGRRGIPARPGGTRRRRARTAGFPRLPRFLRFRAEPTGSDRTGRGPAYFVELVCGPYSCRRVTDRFSVAVLHGLRGAASVVRWSSLPGLVMILIIALIVPAFDPAVRGRRGTFGSWADRRTASQPDPPGDRHRGRGPWAWRRRAGSRRNGRLAGHEVSISPQACLPADRSHLLVCSCSGNRSREY